MKRTIVPINVDELKSGKTEKNGKTIPWTIFKVVAKVLPKDTEQEFTTFDDFRGREGHEIEVEIEENNYKDKNGVEHKGWRINLPKRNLYKEIDELRSRVSALEAIAVDEGASEEEIKVEDVPF